MPATKKTRTLTYNALTGTLHLTDARGEVGYYLDRLACTYGAAYRLTKIVTEGVEVDHYDVLISPDGDGCECKGHLRHSPKGTVCKHVASIRCLRERGSL